MRFLIFAARSVLEPQEAVTCEPNVREVEDDRSPAEPAASPAGARAPSRDVIFVVGMSRSGTSALARVVAMCGGMLPQRLLPANFANPTGYWESERAVELNDEFLAAHGSSWYDGSLALNAGLVGAAERRTFVSVIADFFDGEVAAGGPLVVKDPRITGLLPYWTAAARVAGLSVKILHVFREPAEVVASLAQRDGLAADHALALWLKYNLVGERDARAFPRAFVAYDELIEDWEDAVARCIARLGLGITIGDAMRPAVAGFLQPELRHHRGAAIESGAQTAALAAIARETYELLRSGAREPVRTADFDEILRAYAASRAPLEFRLSRSLMARPR